MKDNKINTEDIEVSKNYLPEDLVTSTLNHFDTDDFDKASSSTLAAIWDDLDAMDADLH